MTRWDATSAPRGRDYDQRWEQLAASGDNIHGEADLVESLLKDVGGTRVLDAGCGTGRVGIELHRRGYVVVGVDADDGMLATARDTCADIDWMTADLAELADHVTARFDVVVLAGNVMIFLTPGSEARVLAQCAARLRPGGLLVAGFSVRPERLSLSDYDSHAETAGLTAVDRYATWDGDRFTGGDYAVSVHRRGSQQ
ncbi:class I SAM-dependent DNA methyltransferase [Gordonia sp. NPDC003950]